VGVQLVTVKTVRNSIKIAYSGKKLGDTSGSDSPNFAKFVAHFPDKKIYRIPATGQDGILEIDGKTPEQVLTTSVDALITHKTSNTLILRAADCIPLVFFAPGHRILGLAHVGTTGAALHLPAKMIAAMGLPAADLQVYAGPHISQKSYRFEEGQFKKELDSSWDAYITHEQDGTHLNLLGYVIDELQSQGVKESNITVENVDTGADPEHFSNRRHKLTGEPDGRNGFAVYLL